MINQSKVLCVGCMSNCAVAKHHYIRRNDLSTEEITDDKFMIPLCHDCHKQIHDDDFDTKGGVEFYTHHNLIRYLLRKCGNDKRFVTLVESYKSKINNLK